MYLYKGIREKNLEQELNQYTKIIATEYLKCVSLNIFKQNTICNIDCPYKYFTQNCASNNVYHISEWVFKYWNSKREEHCERTKRIICRDCLNVMY